ncbi:hypothetical protein TOT_010000398 [Theileria orientalis strain Shintoku]|uniref:Uncharacterized protein n=1 Tax=Theileria orientalis strain Shintoku TaxID=869250 RepID=J4C7F2_THEOR|nr:LOW QUALITY PROTEIN: hypothetical protein TOT_010000398 [Theileria orientalis strain Shintoku]BAM38933.1 hypothetical protein TOT_010000398 [Theileria orientalis strain Shintoku]|eukprot:XP_009689234.1 LOW QUALITY PROTEIN: hypothetical protein TOT_010000398 [Theileria orientalis strain Shintoku]
MLNDVKVLAKQNASNELHLKGHYSQPQPPDYATSVAKWFNPLKTNTPGKTDGRYMCLYELQSSAQSGTSNAPQKASSQQAETGKQYTNDNLRRDPGIGVTLQRRRAHTGIEPGTAPRRTNAISRLNAGGVKRCDKLPGWATLAPRKPSVNRLITPSKHRSREVPTSYKNTSSISSTKVA